jgi:hypothetical protein
MPLTLEMHHLDPVAEGGTNDAANLICLCPNCHTQHHQSLIPESSLRTWKHVLLSLNEAYDRRSVDILLAIHRLGSLGVSGDGALNCASLLASELLDIGVHVHGHVSGHGADILVLRLSEKGKRLVEGWLEGNEAKAYAAAP